MKRIAVLAIILGTIVATPSFGVRRDNDSGCDLYISQVVQGSGYCYARNCEYSGYACYDDGSTGCNYECNDWQYCMTA